MSIFKNLKNTIAANIKDNGVGEITGTVLQEQLINIINELGSGMRFIGVATPTTNPGAPEAPCFYIATKSGQYINFLNSENTYITLEKDSIYILQFNNEYWESQNIAETPPDNTNYLTFMATERSNTIKISGGPADTFHMEYRINNSNWTSYTLASTITVPQYSRIQFRGKNSYWAKANNARREFTMTGSFRASGNIYSLMYYNDLSNCVPTASYNFCGLFRGCTSLITPPEIGSVALYDNCYREMFYGCTNLLYPPKMDHILLSDKAVRNNWIYADMFYNCAKLKYMPEFTWSYGNHAQWHMFYGCTSLTQATIKGTALGDISNLFEGCISLRYVKSYINEVRNATSGDITNWLKNVSPTGVFVKVGTYSYSNGPSGVPEGWVVEEERGDSDMLIENIKNIIIASGGKTYILQLPEDVYELAMADSEVIALLADYPNFIIVK